MVFLHYGILPKFALSICEIYDVHVRMHVCARVCAGSHLMERRLERGLSVLSGAHKEDTLGLGACLLVHLLCPNSILPIVDLSTIFLNILCLSRFQVM